MATDFNQVSQELAQDMELLRGSVQRGTSELNRFSSMSQSTVEKLRAIDAVGSTFVKGLYNGSDALDVMAATAKQAGASTNDLISKFGIVGQVLGFFIKRTTDIAARGFEDLNKIFRGYAQISRQGATGAKGITAFYEQATKMGYGVEQLNEFAQLIGQNTETLSMFGNGIVNAFDQIAKVSEAFTAEGIRGDMLAMGMRLEDINGGIMKYARLMAMSGRQEGLTQKQLTDGAQKYIMELDRLSKLTGQNADVLQAEREARLQDERLAAQEFLASQREAALRAEGRIEEADALKAVRDAQQSMLAPLPKEIKREFEAALSGIITGPKMGSLLQIMPQAMRYFAEGGLDEVKFQQIIKEDLGKFLGERGEQSIGTGAALVANASSAFNFAIQDMIAAFLGTKRVTKETTDAATKNQIITDQTTNSIAQLNNVFIIVKQSLQNMLQYGIQPVTRAFEYMVSKLFAEEGTYIPQLLPRPPFSQQLPAQFTNIRPSPAITGPVTATDVDRQREGTGQAPLTPEGAAAQDARAAVQREMERRNRARQERRQSGVGRPGPTPAAAAGQDPSNPLNQTPASERSLLDIFTFGSQSGSAANFYQLESSFRDRVINAADQYNKLTGNKIQINSAFRSREDQQRLYDSGTVGPDGKRYIDGRPVAPPGNSDHERGVAIDIQNFNDPLAVQKMNEAGLFQRIANDNVHFTARFGRLTSGPLSGYRATLHGNEVVIPLSNGTTIPLDMTPLIRNLDSNAQALSAQIQRLDDLIMLSRDTLNVNRKMLSYRG